MRILLYNTYATFGGAARACHRLHESFRNSGHESELVVRHHDGTDLRGVHVDKRCHSKLWAASDQSLARFRSCAPISPESTYLSPPSHPRINVTSSEYFARAEAINIHWVADYLSPRDLRALFNCGKPMVWTLHDARAFTGGCHYPGDCRQFTYSCAECPQLSHAYYSAASVGLELQNLIFDTSAPPVFVTPSAWLARLAMSSPRLAKARIEVIPNSIDLKVYQPRAIAPCLENTGIPREALVVLFGAHSVKDKRKGVDLVLEAIKHCMAQHDLAGMISAGKLVFACFGELQKTREIDGLPIKMFGSFTDDGDAAKMYRSADIFVCASREDNLPNTVMEAMACGLAVVATDAGGIPEMIDDSTGRLVANGDAKDLAFALTDLIRNKDKTRIMGAMGRKKCEDLYAPSRQANSYINLFEDLLAHPPQRSSHLSLAKKARWALAESRIRRIVSRF